MELSLTLALPSDGVSVPVARRLLRSSLDVLGVEPEVVADIELAVTEACTNVLDHAQDADDYEVRVALDSATCVIEVVHHGGAFDGSGAGLDQAAPDAEEGRGIQLMRGLLDGLSFESSPDVGNVVRMEKELVLRPRSPLEALEGA